MDDPRIVIAPVALVGLAITAVAVIGIVLDGVPSAAPAATVDEHPEGTSPPAAVAGILSAYAMPPDVAIPSSAVLHALIDGEILSMPLSHWDIGLTWDAGEALCIVGQEPVCLAASAGDVSAQVEAPWGMVQVSLQSA